MVFANHFSGNTDSDVLNAAIESRDSDGIVVIEPRHAESEPTRTHWLLDRAILLPSNTTVILRNCKLKLSDRCRDNFFRSANCGLGIEENAQICNVHIKGEGKTWKSANVIPMIMGKTDNIYGTFRKNRAWSYPYVSGISLVTRLFRCYKLLHCRYIQQIKYILGE